MKLDKEIIINELKTNQDGYTISDLASKLNVSRHVIRDILIFLEGAGEVAFRQIGMAKLYYLNNKNGQ